MRVFSSPSNEPPILTLHAFLILEMKRQDRITDHRANYSRHGWESMFRGELLDDFQGALIEKNRLEKLKAAGLEGMAGTDH